MRAAPIGIGVVVDRVLTEVNDCLCAMTGYSKKELLGKDAPVLEPKYGGGKVPGDNRKGFGNRGNTVEEKGRRPVRYPSKFQPDQSRQSFDECNFTAIDITERKLAEEKLMRSEKRFRSILDQAADVILVHDLHGRFLDVNRQACGNLGYSREELLAMKISDIDPRAVADALRWESIAKGERYTFKAAPTQRRKHLPR